MSRLELELGSGRRERMGLDTDTATATHDCEQNHAGIPSASAVYGYGVQSPPWRNALVGQRGEVTCGSKRRNSGCQFEFGLPWRVQSSLFSLHVRPRMRPETHEQTAPVTGASSTRHLSVVHFLPWIHGTGAHI